MSGQVQQLKIKKMDCRFIWYNLPNKLKALCELVECEETSGRLKIIDLTN